MRNLINICEQDWRETYVNGRPVVRIANDSGQLVPPDYLYRVMSRDEYNAAKRVGAFRPLPGERIHASEQPMLQYGSGVDSVVVKFKYDDADGWRAKWGDRLYAVTDKDIPFDRATLV